jgi:tRNA 2-selenouridine synthase
VTLHGHKVIEHWEELARQGAWNELVGELLTRHYDPAYRRSTESNFASLGQATRVQLDKLDPASLSAAAARLNTQQQTAAA